MAALRLGYSAALVATERSAGLAELAEMLLSHSIVTSQFYPPERSLPLVESANLATVMTQWAHYGFRFNVHCPHTVNLAAHPVAALNAITTQIGALPGAIVVHLGQITKARPGPATSSDLTSGLARVCANLNRADLVRTRPILLENAAGEGTLTNSKSFEYGRSLEEIRLVYEGLDSTTNIGLCLDTQHAFAAGLCQWANHDSVETFLDQVDSCAPGKIQTIHLNGSYKAWASRVDRHAPLGFSGLVKGKAAKDYIWASDDLSDQREGLRTLLHRAAESGWDVISETPQPASDFKFISQLWS